MAALTVKLVERWQPTGYLDQLQAHLERRGVQVIAPAAAKLGLREWMRRQDFDVLHLHAPHYWSPTRNLLAPRVAAARARRRRIVWTAHDVPDETANARFVWTTRLLVRSADAVICHGEPTRRLLIERFAAREPRLHVLPHPSFVGVFPRRVGRDEARRALGLEPDAFVYLLLGNVRRTKGARRFLRALDELGDRDARFVVAGRPEDAAEVAFLRDEATRRAWLRLFLDEIPGDRLQLFYAAADVAVFPYLHITTSGALFLAMSFGLPVVGAELHCLGADIHPEGGIKYAPADARGLEQALLEVRRRSRAERAAMGERNLLRMAAWTWPHFAEACERLYRSRD